MNDEKCIHRADYGPLNSIYWAKMNTQDHVLDSFIHSCFRSLQIVLVQFDQFDSFHATK